MPVQTQNSSFAKRMGARVAQAHMQHKDKPADAGERRLPAGVKDGIAKISAAYTKEYPDDKNGPGTKGQPFFRISAIAMSPETNDKGEKVAGLLTQVIIPLCDMPAKDQRKASSFDDNWYEFQNLFKLLGINPPNETSQTDPTGAKIEAYYFAAMKALTDPQKPTYVSFSTRGWTPPVTQQRPKPTEMVFEDWHGLAQWNGKHDPAAGVTVAQPDANSAPPSGPVAPPTTPSVLNPNPTAEQPEFNELASGLPETNQDDVIASLVEVAMADPNGDTEDGASAGRQLEEAAWANGWTKEQTAAASGWDAVGDMCLNKPTTGATTATATTQPSSVPAVGDKRKFAKRTKDGSKLKDNKGVEFPAQEVEVTSVDAASRTCTLKSVKDGKAVVDIRTKSPIAVKWEWLE